MLDKVYIAAVNLSSKDIIRIHNFLNLNKEADYEIVELDQISKAHIVIYDASHPIALKKVNALVKRYNFTGIIAIGEGHNTIDDRLYLKRPLNVRKFNHALSEVIHQQHNIPSSNESFNVLVVDDSLAVQAHMVQKVKELYNQSIDVCVADSGEQALSIMESQTFDLIFLDVMMPGINGYQCCKDIKSKYQSKVVMLTGKSSAINRVRAKMAGCDNFLSKPPKDIQLQKIIDFYYQPQNPIEEQVHV